MVSSQLPRRRRAATLLVSAFLLGAITAQPALAQTQQSDLGVAQSGYFTRTHDPTKTVGGEVAPIIGVDAGTVTGGTPGWPRKDNYLYVARINGADDSHGYASLDLFGMPFGAIVHAMSLEYQIENEADAGTALPDIDVANLPVQLCLVITEWAAGDAGPWDLKPASDCAVAVAPTFVEAKQVTEPDSAGNDKVRNVVVYRADLIPMAIKWAEDTPNYGFSFQPTTDAPSNFQVAVRTPGVSPEAMVGRVTYEPPEDEFEAFADDFMTEGGTFGFGDGAVGSLPAGGGAFRVAEPEDTTARPVRALPASSPITPWWVWTIVPLGLAGIALLARVATADVTVSERVGPVTRLVQRREAMRAQGA